MVDRAEPAMRASSSPSLDQRRAKLALQDRITLCKRSGIGGRVPFVWQASLRTRLGAPSAGNARRVRSPATVVSRGQTAPAIAGIPVQMVDRAEPVSLASFLQYVLLKIVSSVVLAHTVLKQQQHAQSAFQEHLRMRLGAPSAGTARLDPFLA